jgi:hypothetical protein
MPVLNKEIELDDGSKILVRQASGMEKMSFESILAKAFRKYRHFGFDQTKWTDEQMEDFMSYTEELGGSMQEQMLLLVPPCILTEDFDVNTLTAEELRDIFMFVRGGAEGDEDGAPPLDSSDE